MTNLEKLMEDHPDPSAIYKKWFGGIEDVINHSCPSSWGYQDCEREKCNPHSYCKKCWNSEIKDSDAK